MSAKIVIIVPSQGDNANAFADVALKLRHEVYKHAIIVKTTLSDSGGKATVTFSTLSGSPFSFNPALHLARVITISHAMADGPNLAMESDDVPVNEHQPWGADGKLNDAGKAFWNSVGKSMRAHGKILLFGCKMGKSYKSDGSTYAQQVAAATGRQVYAATDSFGAGNSTTVLKHVHLIEHGHTKAPLKSFQQSQSLAD
jgi:hypothetical protein